MPFPDEDMTPAISVLMTVYNREDYIGDAIESVQASDTADWELVIVDDQSTDRSVEIAQSYAAQDPRIHVHINSQNLGDYPNRNRAASFARGRYLKYSDSDDMVHPWTLSAMLHCVERFPDAGLGLAMTEEAERPHPVCYTPEEIYRRHFFERDVFGRAPGSSMIRREAFEAIGGFSGLRQIGDFEFYLAICSKFPTVSMPIGLTFDRVHAAQEQKLDSEASKNIMRLALIGKALAQPDCPLSPAERKAARHRLLTRGGRAALNMAIRHLQPLAALQYYRGVRSALSSVVPVHSLPKSP